MIKSLFLFLLQILKAVRGIDFEIEFAVGDLAEGDIHVGHALIRGDQRLVPLTQLPDALGNHVHQNIGIPDGAKGGAEINSVHEI
jgi:hypothetical protein